MYNNNGAACVYICAIRIRRKKDSSHQVKLLFEPAKKEQQYKYTRNVIVVNGLFAPRCFPIEIIIAFFSQRLEINTALNFSTLVTVSLFYESTMVNAAIFEFFSSSGAQIKGPSRPPTEELLCRRGRVESPHFTTRTIF